MSECVGIATAQIRHKIPDDVLPILRASARTNDVDHPLTVERGISKIIEHERSVRTLTEQDRIVGVIIAQASDSFSFRILPLLFSPLQRLTHIGESRLQHIRGFRNTVTDMLAVLKHSRSAAHLLIEHMGIDQTQMTHLSKGYRVYGLLLCHRTFIRTSLSTETEPARQNGRDKPPSSSCSGNQ